MSVVFAGFSSEKLKSSDATVLSFTGVETMNDLDRFTIVIRCETAAIARAALDGGLVGHGATLVLRPDRPTARRVRGYVRAVRMLAAPLTNVADEYSTIEVDLVSRLWLLGERTQSRIFQDKTTREIVDAICDEWRVERTWRIGRPHERHPYVTQYNETDLEFLRRVLAREGIAFYAAEPAHAESHEEAFVFQDDPRLSPRVGGGALPSWERQHGTDEEIVFDVSAVARICRGSVRLSDYDFRKPALSIVGKADVPPPKDDDTALDLRRLQTAIFFDASESDVDPAYTELSDAHAATVLEQERRDARVIRGASTSWRLRPGHAIAIETHEGGVVDPEIVPVEVRHAGRTTEGIDAQHVDYEIGFVAVPASVLYRPGRPALVHRAVTETATVTGEGDEIVTDEMGRVKVRFHWSSASSCWLRVAQPWSGTGFGAQFIPRVGTEVLVTFLGGDMDRPIVSGSLYNGTHPLPFKTPEERTRSGFRTKSSRGSNELSFDDAEDREEVRLVAQRNLVEVVRRDRQTSIDRDHVLVVKGEHQRRVGKENVVVDGPASYVVNGENKQTILGGHTQTVGGNGDLRYTGALTQQAAREHTEIEGPSTLHVKDDRTMRVKGHALTIVGEHDKRTSSILHVEGTSVSYSAGTTEISSAQAIEIRCGKSTIRLTPDAIELVSPNFRVHAEHAELAADDDMRVLAKNDLLSVAKKILSKAEGASVALYRDAKVDGQLVKLNCGPDPKDAELPKVDPKPPTKLKLVDQEGKPIKNQRFRLHLADGTERSGFLDEEGCAEMILDQSGEVAFPDVDNPRRG